MIKKIIMIATAAMLSGCVTAASKFESEMPVGTVLSNQVETPQGDILLPPGDWTVIGKSIFRNNNYHPFGEVVLAKLSDDNQLDGLVIYSTTLESNSNYGFEATGGCDRQENYIYHEKSANQDLGVQGCVIVRELNTSLAGSPSAHIIQADNYLDVHEIERPDTMLFSSYRVVRGHKLLIAQYGFNYRQPTDQVIPGYVPIEKFNYEKQFGTETWKTNLETVIAWSKEKEALIRTTFLD